MTHHPNPAPKSDVTCLKADCTKMNNMNKYEQEHVNSYQLASKNSFKWPKHNILYIGSLFSLMCVFIIYTETITLHFQFAYSGLQNAVVVYMYKKSFVNLTSCW